MQVRRWWAVTSIVVAASIPATTSSPNAGAVVDADSVAEGEYIVSTHLTPSVAEALVERAGAEVLGSYPLGGTLVVVSADADQASAIEVDPRLAVHPNRVVRLDTTQTNAPWGLDRIDQATLPLNGTFRYAATGAGVKAYVVDSGVRATHTDFGGRVATGFDAGGFGGAGIDCSPSGHGTHVAGTVGGATYGVAKAVTIVPVRVFGCSNVTTSATIIAGLSWIVQDHLAGQPAVANLSLGSDVIDPALEQAVRAVVADGVTVVAAAGNAAQNACGTSPARMPEVIAAGASDTTDARAVFSNSGPCVDLYAPGVSIPSTSSTSDTGTRLLSGTSMATPHVAGAVAQLLAESPALTPAQVASTLVGRSVTVAAGPLLQSLPRWPLTVARSGAGSGLVTSTGGAIDCGPDCSTVVDDGTAITLQATPSQGSRFLGWSGACAGSAAGCTVTVTDATSVGAEFDLAACASVSASGRAGWWPGSWSTAGVSGPTLSGAVGYGPGFVGDGFVFDGSGSLSSTALPTLTDAITVMAWVRPSSMMRVQSVISRSTGPGFTSATDASHGFALRLGFPWGVEWEVDDPTARVPEVMRAQVHGLLDDGAWHHIAATWSPGSMAVFVDGLEVARQASPSESINPAVSTAFRVGGEEASPFDFIGSLDEPAVFSRVLSTSEIASVHAAATSGFCS
jgi:subtilisin family serine protease